jgi:hypothetical protein
MAKKNVWLAAILAAALLAPLAHAQSTDRDALIAKIEDAMGRPAAVTAEAPVVTAALKAAKQANPDADDATWAKVRTDTAAAFTKMASGPGSAFDQHYQEALQGFSDEELKSVVQKLNDPLLVKLRESLKGQKDAYKKRVMPGIAKLSEEINEILAKYHLKQVESSTEVKAQ